MHNEPLVRPASDTGTGTLNRDQSEDPARAQGSAGDARPAGGAAPAPGAAPLAGLLAGLAALVRPGTAPTSRVWRRLSLTVFVGVSAAMLALVARTMYSRFFFPYELSKMEGYLVEHTRWLLHGNPIFAAPNEHFVAFLYTPLIYWAGAPLMALGVDGFISARLVALVGLGSAIALGMWLVARATGVRWLPLVVPVLFLARYFDVNAFYDHARADNLMAVFAITSLVALTLAPSRAMVLLFVGSGLLAFWTKQSSTVLYAALLAGYAVIHWRSALVCAVLLFGSIFATFVVANAATDGWLHAYTIDAPGYHTLDHWHLVKGLRQHIFGSFGVASVLAGLAALAVVFSGRWPDAHADARARTRYMVVVAGVAAGGFTVASLWQPVSMENVLVFYAVVSAILVPVVLAWGIEQLASAAQRAVAWNMALVLMALVVAQGFQHPGTFHPTAADAREWRRLETLLARYGPREKAWVTQHGSAWGGALDTPASVHRGALCDLIGGYFGTRTPYDAPDSLFDSIEAQHWDVVLIKGWDEGMKAMLAGRYVKDPANEGIRLPAFAGYGAAWEEFWIPIENPSTPYVRIGGGAGCDLD